MQKNINFISVGKTRAKLNEEITYGGYIDSTRDVYSVAFEYVSYMNNLFYFVCVDIELKKVFYTMTIHGYLEDWDS